MEQVVSKKVLRPSPHLGVKEQVTWSVGAEREVVGAMVPPQLEVGIGHK